MIETLKRIKETENLLSELKSSSHERENFRTKLNVFISSARTITLVMQKEGAPISGFNDWYELKQKEMKENELFKYFIDKRNTIQKEGSVRIMVKVSFQFVTDDKGEAIIDLGKERNGQLETIDKKWNVKNAFKDRPDDDAIDLCEKYLEELKKISFECIEKFSKN